MGRTRTSNSESEFEMEDESELSSLESSRASSPSATKLSKRRKSEGNEKVVKLKKGGKGGKRNRAHNSCEPSARIAGYIEFVATTSERPQCWSFSSACSKSPGLIASFFSPNSSLAETDELAATKEEVSRLKELIVHLVHNRHEVVDLEALGIVEPGSDEWGGEKFGVGEISNSPSALPPDADEISSQQPRSPISPATSTISQPLPQHHHTAPPNYSHWGVSPTDAYYSSATSAAELSNFSIAHISTTQSSHYQPSYPTSYAIPSQPRAQYATLPRMTNPMASTHNLSIPRQSSLPSPITAPHQHLNRHFAAFQSHAAGLSHLHASHSQTPLTPSLPTSKLNSISAPPSIPSYDHLQLQSQLPPRPTSNGKVEHHSQSGTGQFPSFTRLYEPPSPAESEARGSPFLREESVASKEFQNAGKEANGKKLWELLDA